MGSFNDFLEDELLDHVFGNAAYTAPATLYAALYTADPNDAGGGTEVGTGTWTNYARVAITNNATNFPAASGGSKSNGVAISFGTATTTGSVAVTGIAILDASSGGNFLGWSSLTTPKTVTNGDPVSFAIGALAITLT